MDWMFLVYLGVQRLKRLTVVLQNVRAHQVVSEQEGHLADHSPGQNLRLPPLRIHTLESDSESDNDQALESTAAKLRRLKAELAEVEAEIQAGPSKRTESSAPKRRSVLPPRPLVDMAEELSAFKQRLEAVEGADTGPGEETKPDEDEWTTRLERLRLAESSSQSKQEDTQSRDVTRDISLRDKSSVSDLDKRLARLEAAFGSDEISVSANTNTGKDR